MQRRKRYMGLMDGSWAAATAAAQPSTAARTRELSRVASHNPIEAVVVRFIIAFVVFFLLFLVQYISTDCVVELLVPLGLQIANLATGRDEWNVLQPSFLIESSAYSLIAFAFIETNYLATVLAYSLFIIVFAQWVFNRLEAFQLVTFASVVYFAINSKKFAVVAVENNFTDSSNSTNAAGGSVLTSPFAQYAAISTVVGAYHSIGFLSAAILRNNGVLTSARSWVTLSVTRASRSVVSTLASFSFLTLLVRAIVISPISMLFSVTGTAWIKVVLVSFTLLAPDWFLHLNIAGLYVIVTFIVNVFFDARPIKSGARAQLLFCMVMVLVTGLVWAAIPYRLLSFACNSLTTAVVVLYYTSKPSIQVSHQNLSSTLAALETPSAMSTFGYMMLWSVLMLADMGIQYYFSLCEWPGYLRSTLYCVTIGYGTLMLISNMLDCVSKHNSKMLLLQSSTRTSDDQRSEVLNDSDLSSAAAAAAAPAREGHNALSAAAIGDDRIPNDSGELDPMPSGAASDEEDEESNPMDARGHNGKASKGKTEGHRKGEDEEDTRRKREARRAKQQAEKKRQQQLLHEQQVHEQKLADAVALRERQVRELELRRRVEEEKRERERKIHERELERQREEQERVASEAAVSKIEEDTRKLERKRSQEAKFQREREEADRRAREEVEHKRAKEEAERKEVERKLKEEAERAEAERLAREEHARKVREEAEVERKAKEAAEKKAKEEAEKRVKPEPKKKSTSPEPKGVPPIASSPPPSVPASPTAAPAAAPATASSHSAQLEPSKNEGRQSQPKKGEPQIKARGSVDSVSSILVPAPRSKQDANGPAPIASSPSSNAGSTSVAVASPASSVKPPAGLVPDEATGDDSAHDRDHVVNVLLALQSIGAASGTSQPQRESQDTVLPLDLRKLHLACTGTPPEDAPLVPAPRTGLGSHDNSPLAVHSAPSAADSRNVGSVVTSAAASPDHDPWRFISNLMDDTPEHKAAPLSSARNPFAITPAAPVGGLQGATPISTVSAHSSLLSPGGVQTPGYQSTQAVVPISYNHHGPTTTAPQQVSNVAPQYYIHPQNPGVVYVQLPQQTVQPQYVQIGGMIYQVYQNPSAQPNQGYVLPQ